jgi:hypothetical protein
MRLAVPAPRLAGLLLLVALAVAASAARTASAGAAMLKGLQDTRLVMSDDGKQRILFWQHAKRAKVRRVRVLVSWDGVARKADPAVTGKILRAVHDADQVDARLFVGIYAAVNRKRATPRTITPTLIDRYSDFTASLGEALSDARLAGYLTWNEPNFKSMWPQNQPRTWVKMSNAGYRSFKREDPGTPVLVGEPAPNARTTNAVNPGAFFRAALCLTPQWRSQNGSSSCRTKLLGDGIAIHTHDFFQSPLQKRVPRDAWTMGNLNTTMAQIRALARAGRISGAAARNVHITEFSYRTHGSARTPDRRAAVWLRQAWAYAKREGVRSMTWYQLQDPGSAEEWRSGMLTAGGRELRTWRTFRSLR